MELLHEGLCEESEAPSLLINHVKISWNSLPEVKKSIVIQQALSNTYGREWAANTEGRTEFNVWLCQSTHQYFLDPGVLHENKSEVPSSKTTQGCDSTN